MRGPGGQRRLSTAAGPFPAARTPGPHHTPSGTRLKSAGTEEPLLHHGIRAAAPRPHAPNGTHTPSPVVQRVILKGGRRTRAPPTPSTPIRKTHFGRAAGTISIAYIEELERSLKVMDVDGDQSECMGSNRRRSSCSQRPQRRIPATSRRVPSWRFDRPTRTAPDSVGRGCLVALAQSGRVAAPSVRTGCGDVKC
jgi:hypothetical protein